MKGNILLSLLNTIFVLQVKRQNSCSLLNKVGFIDNIIVKYSGAPNKLAITVY